MGFIKLSRKPGVPITSAASGASLNTNMAPLGYQTPKRPDERAARLQQDIEKEKARRAAMALRDASRLEANPNYVPRAIDPRKDRLADLQSQATTLNNLVNKTPLPTTIAAPVKRFAKGGAVAKTKSMSCSPRKQMAMGMKKGGAVKKSKSCGKGY